MSDSYLITTEIRGMDIRHLLHTSLPRLTTHIVIYAQTPASMAAGFRSQFQAPNSPKPLSIS